jgi:hypothetical protein
MVSVLRTVEWAGQLVTTAAYEVILWTVVVNTVEVVYNIGVVLVEIYESDVVTVIEADNDDANDDAYPTELGGSSTHS